MLQKRHRAWIFYNKKKILHAPKIRVSNCRGIQLKKQLPIKSSTLSVPNYSLRQSENRNAKHMTEFLFIALDQDSILTIF